MLIVSDGVVLSMRSTVILAISRPRLLGNELNPSSAMFV